MFSLVTPRILPNEGNSDHQLVKFGTCLRGDQKENVWTPRLPVLAASARVPRNLVTPNSAFYAPSSWLKEYTILTRKFLQKDEFVALHRNNRACQVKGKVKVASYVQPVPSLTALKAAVPKENSGAEYDTLWNALYISGSEFEKRKRNVVDIPTPAIWVVNASKSNDIFVLDALHNTVLLCFRNCKSYSDISCIHHVPFFRLMDNQLNSVPIRHAVDLLPIKKENLIETDFVWVGFSDGAIRLIPANHGKYFRNSGKLNVEERTNFVYEVPKFHVGAIVSIARSPSLASFDNVEHSYGTRLSTVMKQFTEESTTETKNQDAPRKHLSLVCTASIDSSVVVWDVKKIYEAMHATRNTGVGKQSNGASFLSSTDFAQDVITVEQIGNLKASQNRSFQRTTQMKCILVNVRPLLRLKGGVNGLTCLSWISSLVTTEGFRPEREASQATRDPMESSAPANLRTRHLVQTRTRFDHREAQRRMLDLSEEEMCDVEAELRVLLPPLAREKLQFKRVNLLLAGDNVGTVHIWNLDEELQHRNSNGELGELNRSSLGEAVTYISSVSPTCSNGVHDAKEKEAAYVQTAPIHSSSTSLAKKPIKEGNSESTSLPSGYISATPPMALPEEAAVYKCSVKVPPIRLSCGSARSRSLRLPSARQTPRLSRLQLLAAQRSGKVPVKLRIIDSQRSARQPRLQRRCAANMSASSRIVREQPSTKHFKKNLVESALLRDQTSLSPLASPVAVKSSFPSRSSLSISSPLGNSSRSFSLLQDSQKLRAPAARLPSRFGANGPNLYPPSLTFATSPLASPTCNREKRFLLSSPLSCLPQSPHVSLPQKESVHSPKPRKPSKMDSSQKKIAASISPLKVTRIKASSAPAVEKASPLRPSSPTPEVMGSSPSPVSFGASTSKDVRSRAAKCRIEFTGGGAVLGMAAQVPSEICVTMRRIPNPIRRERSLLEDWTAEETEQRSLENSFTELNDINAVFFVFQYLQLHLCVEGAVLDFRFTPQWKEKDPDGKELFRKRDFSDVARKMEHPEEITLNRWISLSSFDIYIQKLVLDAHSQPVSAFYFDRNCQHLWVGRHDGLLTVFSSENKYIVSRVPHPFATDALGPPDPILWATHLRNFLQKSQYMKGSKKLEKHEETLHYDDAHFTGFLPFFRESGSSAVIVYHCGEDPTHHPTENSEDIHNSLNSLRQGTTALDIRHLDGRTNLSALDRKHERHLSVFLNYLKYCRSRADSIRKSHSSFYSSEAKRVQQVISYMDTYTAGRFSELVAARKTLAVWKRHHDYFPFQHCCLRLKKEGKDLKKKMAVSFLHRVERERCTRYYFMWRLWVGMRRTNLYHTSICRMIRGSHQRQKRPTEKMLAYLENMRVRKQIFRSWKQMAQKSLKMKLLPQEPFFASLRRRRTERDRTPQRRPNLSPSSSVAHCFDRSFKNIPLDDDMYRFLLLISFIYQTRFSSRFFCHLSGFLNESWVEMLENAKSASDSDDIHDKKVAVLSYGIFPLLQGLVVTSDEVSSHTLDSAVRQEVTSLLQGMWMCLDYVVETPEELLSQLICSGKIDRYSYEDNNPINESKGDLLLFRRDTAVRGIIHHFLVSVLFDDENVKVVQEISQKSEDVMKLLLLCEKT